MKLIAALALLAPLCTLGLVGGPVASSHARATVATDDPPPFVCPLCGGNAELHYKRMTAIAWAGGNVTLRFAMAL